MIQKYLDRGISCIPIRPRSKAAALPSGFQNTEYGLNGISEQMAEEWDKNYPISKGYGIAILCGKASNIIAVDVDSTDPEILKLMPPTPSSKVGKKGGTFFYQYEDKWERKVFIRPQVKADEEIEILTNGQYTLIPPTIHPDTNSPYVWTGEDLLFIDPKKLPYFQDKDIDKIYEYWALKYNTAIDVDVNHTSVELEGPFESAIENGKPRASHGAQNRLKKLAAILLQKNTPLDEAAFKLIEYDKEQHLNVPYFGDSTRGTDGSADPYSNALRFYMSISHRVNSDRRKRGELPHNIAPLSPFNNPIVEKKAQNVVHKMPEPRGRLKDFITSVNQYNLNNVSEISYAYGMAYLSMHLACRYAVHYRGTFWPANLMLFVVASSGMGKNKPRKFMEQLLYESNCLGASEYTSAVSLLSEFTPIFDKKGALVRKPKRALLASIDEVDGLLNIMSKSKESFEARFKKVLLEIFDASKDQFHGQFSKGNGVEGKVFHPFFTLIGSTQPAYFKKALQGDILYKGIYQRSLIFELKEISEADTEKIPDKELEQGLKNFTEQWFKNNHVDLEGFDIVEGKENEVAVNYREIRLSPKAVEYLKELELKFFNEKRISHNQGNDLKTSVKARFIDNIIKLAQIDWIATLPTQFISTPERYSLEVEHIEWAKNVVLAKYEQSKEYFDTEVIQNNKDEQDMDRIVNFIKNKGGKVTGDQMSSGVKVGMSSRRRELINELRERGTIVLVLEQSEGKKPITYYKLV
jgi:hypothetical protein